MDDFDDRLPFRTSQFLRAGGSRGALRGCRYRQVLGGVWVRAEAMDRDTPFRAALAIHPPSAFLSRVSAAAVLGLPVPDNQLIHVTVMRHSDRRFRPQIKPHVTKRPRRGWIIRGMRVTEPITTFIECAGMLHFVDLVILGDALCRKYRITAAALVRACEESTDYYAGVARIAAGFVRDGVDSPMETRLRLLIVLAGLPEPKTNHIVRDEDGNWLRRYDLSYEEIGLIIEFDGRQHAEDTEQWESDIERREELDDQNVRILIVTAKGIFREPERTLQRIRRQLVRRGWPNVPAIDEGWRAVFTD